jgi:hypothetical protein
LENIRENIKIFAKENLGYHKLKHNKPWFVSECSKLIDRKQQAKLHWLQDSSQINSDNLQHLRRETIEHLGKRKENFWKTKLMSLKLIMKTKISEICTET